VQAKFERVERGPGSSLRVLEISQAKFDANWHFHPEWELTWIREGAGRRFVGDCIESFGAGDLVLVGPGVPHFWFSDVAAGGGLSRALVIQFPGDFPGEAFLGLPEMGDVARVLKRGARGLFFSGQGVDEACKRLCRLRNLGAFEAVLELLGVLQLLAATCGRPLAGPFYERLPGENSKTRLGRLYAFLMEHFREPLTLGRIASAVGMSPSACSRFFMRGTGGGIWDFLTQLRVDHCASLLRGSDRGIAEIAFESGFSTLSSFNRHFRQRHGRSPREYRHSFRCDEVAGRFQRS
jgi:AraC-like DNA-binding protein